MFEWHVTPDYIVEHWSRQLFDLMFQKRNERVARENAASASASAGGSNTVPLAQALTELGAKSA